MTEAQYQSLILDYARAVGWHRMHTRSVPVKQGSSFRHITPLSGEEGYPDLTLARSGRIVFLELKAERGRLTDSQVDWLNALTGRKNPIEHWRVERRDPRRVRLPSGRRLDRACGLPATGRSSWRWYGHGTRNGYWRF